MTVYEATQQRLKRIFDDFDNVYVSFSGGKDSGVMLNIVCDIARKIGRKFTVMYMDLEGMYKKTIDFVEIMLENNKDVFLEIHYICLPMLTTNAVSMYEPFWIFWEEAKKEKWIRPMPTYDYVININNHKFPFFYSGMTFEEFVLEYAKWQSESKKTACLVGIRTQESLNRWRAIFREDVNRYKDINYSVKITENCYNFYPIYDWKVKDIWIYNSKFNKPYNKLYDMFYQAGVPLHKMRVCEPYGDEQRVGLNLFKIIEPETWQKVVDRVSGANFGNIYVHSKAIGNNGAIILPKGHTWKSYCKFLLATLPKDTAEIYKRKFIKFIKYWIREGSPLSDEQINKLKGNEYVEITNRYSRRGKGDKFVVKFNSIPDTIIGDNSVDMLSWKRMCMAIIKNDTTCKSLSFSFTKKQLEARKLIMKKYQNLL
jgi:predicted phosphoadenosine phosphosulfate sulfurtransferase